MYNDNKGLFHSFLALAPLRCGVLAVERIFKLNDVTIPLAQEVLLFSVILHQLGQCGELLASIQVIVVTSVLDLNVGHLILTPDGRKKKKEKKKRKFSQLSFIYHDCKQQLCKQK